VGKKIKGEQVKEMVEKQERGGELQKVFFVQRTNI
jgi:hypothetical protein